MRKAVILSNHFCRGCNRHANHSSSQTTNSKSEEKKDFHAVLLLRETECAQLSGPNSVGPRLRVADHRDNLPVVEQGEDHREGILPYQRPITSGNPATVRRAPEFPRSQASFRACAHSGGVQSVGCERDPTGRLEHSVDRLVPGAAGAHFQEGLPRSVRRVRVAERVQAKGEGISP